MRRFMTSTCFLKTVCRNFSVSPIENNLRHFLMPFNKVIICQKRFYPNSVIPCNEIKKKLSPLDPVEPLDLSDYGPALEVSLKLAAYVDRSPLLQELIKLGVSLNELDRNPKAQELILKLNFEKNVKPYLFFLKDCGVPEKEFGPIITTNPFIFKESLDDLEVRINYLKSKKFDKKMISEIIVKNPKWLSFSAVQIDSRLGYLQQSLKLKGFQVRQIICQTPQLATIKQEKIMINLYAIKELMGLNEHQIKKLLLKDSSLLNLASDSLVKTFEYLTTVMKVPLHLILEQPHVLKCKRFVLKERHEFLVMLGRAQYLPYLAGYISLTSLTVEDDMEFCEKVAKCSMESFREYLKTL